MPKPVPRTLLHSGRQIVDRVSEPVKKLAFVARAILGRLSQGAATQG